MSIVGIPKSNSPDHDKMSDGVKCPLPRSQYEPQFEAFLKIICEKLDELVFINRQILEHLKNQ
jgi:hypothetical protein